MLGDDTGALSWLHAVVRVVAAKLVFDVKARLDDLAEVVVVAAHPHQQGIGAHQIGGPLRQVAHDDAVVKGAWCLVLEPAQQRCVQL